MVHLSGDVLARVRSVVYERALPISTRRLQIVTIDLENDEPAAGCAIATPTSAACHLSPTVGQW